MKTWHFIVGLLLFATACANQNLPSPEEDILYHLEFAAKRNRDSTMKVLDTLNVSSFSEKEQAHYCLLRVILMHNARIINAETDSLMQVAENYFIGGDDKYFEARTYNVKAYSGQFFPQHRQLMLEYRLKAKQSIEQCQHVDERLVLFSPEPTTEQDEIDRIKYTIYHGLGGAYCDLGYRREGIELLKETERALFEKQWYNQHCVAALMLGDAYISIMEYDSSKMFLKKGLLSAEMTGNIDKQVDYHATFAILLLHRYEKQKDIDDSTRLHLLHEAVAEEKAALLLDGKRTSAMDGLSHAYYELKQYDSCIYYALRTLELNGPEVWRMNANMYLYKSYEALGDFEKALPYAENYMEVRRKFDNSAKGVAEVKEEYDHQLELQRIENEQQRKRFTFYLLISTLVIVVLLLWHFISQYQKNKELEMLKLQEEQHQLQTKVEQATQHTRELLLQRVSDIYQTSGKDKLRRILETTEDTYPQLSEKLKAAYPNLSESERNILLLNFLQFRIKEEAEILGLSENTVMKYRSDLIKKAGKSPVFDLLG